MPAPAPLLQRDVSIPFPSKCTREKDPAENFERGLVVLEEAGLSEGDMLVPSDDHVIKHSNLQNLTGFREPPCRRNVRAGWRGIIAWVIMHQHDTPCGSNHCGTEHLARLRHGLVQRADAHQVMPTDSMTNVEEQHRKAFDIRVK
jgi:hypothetical protein